MCSIEMQDPWVLRIKSVFLCGFSSAASVWQAAATCQKKGHVSLQNRLPAHRSGNIWERGTGQRGRRSVSTPEAKHVIPCTPTSSKPHRYLKPSLWCITARPRKRRLSLAQWIKVRFSFVALVSIWLCGCLLQHPRLLRIPNMKRWYMRLRAASCLKAGRSMIPHPNRQQVPDSCPTTRL